MLKSTIAINVLLLTSSIFGGGTVWASLGPPGAWGDSCQILEASSEDVSDIDPQIAFERGTRVFLPPGIPKSRWWEDCATRDRGPAIRLFKIAGQATHIGASNQLGLIYKEGEGVEQDFLKAEKWYAVAAHQGDISAILALAEIHFDGLNGHTDYAKAKKWLDKAAEQHNSMAEMRLSEMYEKGLGVKPDEKEAIRWLELAVQHRSTEAHYELGKRMLEGRDVPQNTKKGLVLIKTAARSGNAEANLFMGLAYRDGIGVPKDQEKARQKLSQALSGAIGQDEEELVTKILNEGANPNTHFQRAVFMPDPKTLANYFNGTEKPPEMEQVPVLALAIEHQNLQIASLLLENGAKPNAKLTISQRSVLWVGAEFGNVEIMKLLVQYGADIDAPSAAFHKSPSRTPLDIAFENGQTEGVAYLRSLGADGSLAGSSPSALRSVFTHDIQYRALETDKPISVTHSRTRGISTPVPDYLEELIGQDAPQPISNWQESEKARYRTLLNSQQYDVLIVPIQVQRFAIDPIGRSLMTMYLIDHLRRTTSLRIPDPTFVTKALGDRQRTFNKKDVYKLAKELNVQSIVWGYVGHDRASDMQYTLQIQRKDQSGLHRSTPMIQWDSKVLSFSDETPPEEVYSTLVPIVASRIDATSRNTKPSIETKSKRPAKLALPKDPLSLVSVNQDSPVIAAYSLQLFGALYPIETERERERLFERSLVALTHLNPEHPEIPLLKARALYYLHRRPAALQVVQKPKNPSEKAMRAFLNGDLPDLEQQISGIQAPVKKLLAFFDRVDLRHYYEQTPAIPDEAYIFAKQSPEWSVLIVRRFADLDPWSSQPNAEVKAALDTVFPVPGFALQDIYNRYQIRNPAPTSEQISKSEVDKMIKEVELSVVTHFHKLLKRKPQQWCCHTDLGRTHPWDLLNLYASLGEANLMKQVDLEVGARGNPKSAGRLLDQYASVYVGHPVFTEIRTRTLFEQLKKEESEKKSNLQQRYEQEAYQAVLWSGAQTRSAASALETSTQTVGEYKKAQLAFELPYPDFFPFYSWDVPHRSYWPIFESRFRIMDDNYHRNLALSLKYTNHDIWYLKVVHEESSENDAKALLVSNQHRFIGHPRRTSFLAKVKKKLGDDDGAIRMYQAAIKNGETGWKSYWNLGSSYLLKGNYAEAEKVFHQYPGFNKSPQKKAVELSNHASDAGSLLFWRGAYDKAVPFFEISANLRTGSNAGLISATRLAMMKGDYLAAAKFALDRAKRYEYGHAYGQYFTFLHLLGFSKEAWSGFGAIAQNYSEPDIWDSAFIGHRLQGTRNQQLVQWLKKEHEKRGHESKVSEAGRFAFMAYAIDRQPDSKMIDLIAQLEKGFESRVSAPRVVVNKANNPVGPSSYKGFKDTPLEMETTPDAELVFFAKAYLAMKQNKFAKAFKWFEEKARYYSYRYGPGSYSLPYFSWAAVKTGQVTALKKLLDNYEKPDTFAHLGYKKGFDYFLAKALLAGGQGHHDEGIALIKKAFNQDHYMNWRPLYPWFQIVETCEWLYEDSGQDEYRKLALKWAKDYQVIQPMFAWAYAVEAKYSHDASARKKALAFALHLDSRSERIQEISDEEKANARQWFKANNPFLRNLHLYKTRQLKS